MFKFLRNAINSFTKSKVKKNNISFIASKDEETINKDLESKKSVIRIKDPKEKLKIKLQVIARRTKSYRIREKNIKRLVKLFDEN